MRKILAIIILAATVTSVHAQTGKTGEYYIDGLKVILKQTPKDVVSVRLFVEGGTANYPEDKEGIEDLTLSLMMTGGTATMSKLQFNTAAEKIGTTFGSNTNLDYGSINMTCVKAFWDQSWKLFADAIMNPALSENEFNILKEQAIAGAKQTESNPDAYLANLSRKNAFDGKNYAKISSGTPESLASITLDDVRNYYKKVICKKRCFLVVVGNVTDGEIQPLIKGSISKLPQGSDPVGEERRIITTPKTFVEDRDIATNYIRGIMSAPYGNTKDGVAMRMAMNILGDRFFTELRTKRSLSYAPAAFYASAAVNNPYSVIYISTLDPKQSMQVMVDEINKVKKEGFLSKELANTQQTFLTNYYETLETTASQADALGAAEIQGGWEQLDKITEEVNSVTLKDMNRVFDQYTNAIVWTYLGKKDAVKDDDFKQTQQQAVGNRPY